MSEALNPTAASLLGLLYDGPLSAGDLVRAAEQRIGGFWSLTRSQVYRELDVLASRGLVSPAPGKGRAQTVYSVNDAGRAAFEEWARSGLPEGDSTRLPLLLLVTLGGHLDPEVLRAGLITQWRAHAIKRRRFEDALATWGRDIDDFARATIHYGLRYEEAVDAWFAALPESVRGPNPWPPPRHP